MVEYGKLTFTSVLLSLPCIAGLTCINQVWGIVYVPLYPRVSHTPLLAYDMLINDIFSIYFLEQTRSFISDL